MKAIPSDAQAYKQTPEFSQDTIPAGLLKAHSTKEGTWGEIHILEGELLYTILEPQREEFVLTTERFGVVEPTVLHDVQPLGAVRFYVEFFRV